MRVNLRREVRKQLRGSYVLRWQSKDGVSHSAAAKGKDLSLSGISISCASELQPGTVVFIEGPDAAPRGYCVVRHSAKGSDDLYDIGLEFDEETKRSVGAPEAEPTDYYEFLQISPKANSETIHRIYRFLAGRFHPDNPETGDSEKFLLLNRIYAVLSDPQRRAEYDEERLTRASEPAPIAKVDTFVNGVDGEVNRRLAILALLYNKRRMNCQDPGVSLWDLERRIAMPREYLDFGIWYLKSKGYVTVADNSDLALTALGVDFVEENTAENPMLYRLLTAGDPHAPKVTEMDERENGNSQLRPLRLSSGERY